MTDFFLIKLAAINFRRFQFSLLSIFTCYQFYCDQFSEFNFHAINFPAINFRDTDLVTPGRANWKKDDSNDGYHSKEHLEFFFRIFRPYHSPGMIFEVRKIQFIHRSRYIHHYTCNKVVPLSSFSRVLRD